MVDVYKSELTISEVAEILKVQIHNIRHWENELKLEIKRNELNQRVYTKEDIDTFRWVIELKKEGLNLKAIKTVLNKAKMINEGMQEVAASKEVAVVNSNYGEAISNFKEDILRHISVEIENAFDAREYKLQRQIESLKEKIEYIADDRNNKLDSFISEWREKNKKKNLLKKIFSI